MKKFLCTFLLLIISVNIPLQADLDSGDLGSQTIEGYESLRPFYVDVFGEIVGKTKFDEDEFRDQHLKYSTWGIEAGFGFYYDPCYLEGAYLEAEYDVTRINWEKNPFFDDKNFRIATFSIGGFTERFARWKWVGEVGVNIDARKWDFDHYANYDAILWGRYTYCRDIGLHVGLLVYTGMKIDWVYPIVGFDWKISDSFKLNAIFPINFSAIYTFNCNWSVGLASRLFLDRFRADKHEPLPMALVIYRAAGLEAILSYNNDWIDANIHAGGIMGGQLKIANHDYERRKRLDFKSAPYAGGEIKLKF